MPGETKNFWQLWILCPKMWCPIYLSLFVFTYWKLFQKFKIPTLTPTGTINKCLVLTANEIVAHLKYNCAALVLIKLFRIGRKEVTERFEAFRAFSH